jgi:pimeloyl-ACP methyl ester carboxylesterase
MFENKFITVEGIKTRYWASGNQGSPVLLIHGIGCSVLEWERNMAALSARHRVFALDLLGFGLSDKPLNETYNINRLAQFSLAFLTALNIPRAHFAGNSLGGGVSLECARLAPERVASLLLVDPAGMDLRGTLLEFRLATIPILGEMITKPNKIGTRMLWNKAFANPAPFVTDELVNTKVELARLPNAHKTFLKTLRSFCNFRGFKNEHVEALHKSLPNIKARTLVVWGQNDQFVTVEHAKVLQRLMPNIEVQIFENCGHAPQVEESEKFNEVALKFWGTQKNTL